MVLRLEGINEEERRGRGKRENEGGLGGMYMGEERGRGENEGGH